MPQLMQVSEQRWRHALEFLQLGEAGTALTKGDMRRLREFKRGPFTNGMSESDARRILINGMGWSKADAISKRRRELAELPFTKEEKARWAPMLHATWQAIGPDAEQAMRASHQRMTKGIIVEFVCDANRVMEYGEMTLEEYDFLSAIYSRPSVKRWLYKELNY